MTEMLEEGIEIADGEVRESFENIWSEVVGEMPKNYRIMIWGSTVEERRDPVDLDIIFEYETDYSVSPEQEESIEGWLKSEVRIDNFSYIDPLVVNYIELPSIISRSRVSRVYSVDEDGWVEFD